MRAKVIISLCIAKNLRAAALGSLRGPPENQYQSFCALAREPHYGQINLRWCRHDLMLGHTKGLHPHHDLCHLHPERNITIAHIFNCPIRVLLPIPTSEFSILTAKLIL